MPSILAFGRPVEGLVVVSAMKIFGRDPWAQKGRLRRSAADAPDPGRMVVGG